MNHRWCSACDFDSIFLRKAVKDHTFLRGYVRVEAYVSWKLDRSGQSALISEKNLENSWRTVSLMCLTFCDYNISTRPLSFLWMDRLETKQVNTPLSDFHHSCIAELWLGCYFHWAYHISPQCSWTAPARSVSLLSGCYGLLARFHFRALLNCNPWPG